MKQIYVFFIFISLSISSLAKTSWEESAVKLSGDPEIRAQGIKELKSITNLSEQLRANFAVKKDLVLTVIRTLKMHEFLPRLLELTETTMPADLKWDLVETVTVLSDPKDEKKLTETFAKKLETKNLPDATLLALLTGLQKYHYPVSEKKLLSLLEHSSYEIRIASVQIAAVLTQKDPKYNQVAQKAIMLSPYQLRLQAYNTYAEDSDSAKLHKKEINKSCSEEKNTEVKELCSKIMTKIKGDG